MLDRYATSGLPVHGWRCTVAAVASSPNGAGTHQPEATPRAAGGAPVPARCKFTAALSTSITTVGAVILLGAVAGCSMFAARRAAALPLAPTFTCQQLIDKGEHPFAVAAGDWNKDGRVDLAVTYAGTGDLYPFLNQGNRTFRTGAVAGLGLVSRGIAAGDINGDGVLDLAVANAMSNDAVVLLGDGTGGFKRAAQFRTGVGPFQPALTDLDGDGYLDLIVVNESNWGFAGKPGTVTILYGRQGGEFSQPVDIEAGDHPSAVIVADFDGQHGPDLAVSNWMSETVSILLNGGDRTFRHAAEIPYGGDRPYSVYAADFDKDGAIDLAVTDVGGTVRVLYGDGAGNFAPGTSFGVGKGARWVTGADLDGDGNVDLITADTAANTVSLLMGRGKREFAPAVAVPVGRGPRMVLAQDLDGDGKIDLAVTDETANDVVLLFQTAGQGTPCPPLPGKHKQTDEGKAK